MAQIFISYRRDDGGHSWSIYQHLRLWFDEKDVFIDHEALDSGQSFKPALRQPTYPKQTIVACELYSACTTSIIAKKYRG